MEQNQLSKGATKVEQFKIENFKQEHPGLKFPEYESLNENECQIILNKLVRNFGFKELSDGLLLLKNLENIAKQVSNVNSEIDVCDFKSIMLSYGIDIPKHIYINWYRFDRIDKMKLDDFSKFFFDIWYPSSDDINIFDDSFYWIISITHFGSIELVKL